MNFLYLQLDKLKRSYHKLQRKHVKETSGGVKEKNLSEVTQLHEKIEVQLFPLQLFLTQSHLQIAFYCHLLVVLNYPCLSLQEHRQRAAEWEQQHVQSQKQLTALEAQNRSLTDELTRVKVKAEHQL